MWNSLQTLIEKDEIIEFQILEQGAPISFAQFFDYLHNDAVFRSFYNKLLAEHPWPAYFWEHPPLTGNQLESTYKFVLVEGRSLEKLRPNKAPFEAYFKEETMNVSFDNLGKNARLVVPRSIGSDAIYTHLARFVRKAPENQIHDFWQLVARESLEAIKIGKRWLSTHGLGVAWLHIRLDQRPKYYHYKPFKLE